jgi:hypothetical protein
MGFIRKYYLALHHHPLLALRGRGQLRHVHHVTLRNRDGFQEKFMVYLVHADGRQQYLWWQKVIVYLTQAKYDDSATGGRISKSTWSIW